MLSTVKKRELSEMISDGWIWGDKASLRGNVALRPSDEKEPGMRAGVFRQR